MNMFRCHVDECFKFNNLITLIRGGSGKGKSTIFSAIYFALYGQMQHIHNHTAPKSSKTSVTLEIGNMIIYRQKRPELLRVTMKDTNKSYEDKVAQEIIIDHYGSRDIWYSCCYLEQNSRSFLLSASNTDKMELLNALAFSSENPEIYLNKIDQKVSQLETELNIRQKKYEIQAKELQELLDDPDIDMDKFCPPGNRKTKNEEMIKNKAEIVELRAALASQQKLKGMILSLEQNRDNLLAQIGELSQKELLTQIQKDEYDTEYETLESKISLIPVIQQIKKLKQDIVQLQDKIDKCPDIDDSVSESDVAKLTIQNEKYQNATKICKKHNIDYDKDVIKKYIKDTQNILDMQPKLQTYVSICKVLDEIDDLESKIEKEHGKNKDGKGDDKKSVAEIDNEIEKTRNNYEKLKMSTGLVKCPHCSKSVRILAGKLAPESSEPASPEALTQANKDLKNLMEQRKTTLDLESLNKQYDKLLALVGGEIPEEIPKPLEQSEISSRKTKITELSRVEWLEKPTQNIDQLKKILELNRNHRELITRRDRLQKDLDKLPKYSDDIISMDVSSTSTSQFQNRMKEIRKILSDNSSLESKKVLLDNQLDSVLDKLYELNKDIKEIKSESISDLEKNVRDIDEMLKLSVRIDALLVSEAKINEEAEELKELYDDLVAARELKNKAIEVECLSLQSTIDSINVALSDISTAIFEDPISIRINSLKKMKTAKERIKPKINLSISYKSALYDNINQLSGGEIDRVSLAVTLALAKLNSCPILLLDECMASLDDSLRETCINVLKDTIGHQKTVLCVLHECTEGFFNNIIEIK